MPYPDTTNQFADLPIQRDFGLQFDYSVWDANTEITLCNVPWDATYRDVVFFPNAGTFDTYLESVSGPKTIINKMIFLKPGHPIRVDLPFNAANRYNYVKVWNPKQPVLPNETPRAFYYFIQQVEYIAPNTTQIQVQLDVWQTYIRDVTMGRCYIERGHIGIAASNANKDRDILLIPEGLNMGDGYEIINGDAFNLLPGGTGQPRIAYVVTASQDITIHGGTVDFPKIEMPDSAWFHNLEYAAVPFYFRDSDFSRFMTAIRDKPWILQGILSIRAIPALTLDQEEVYIQWKPWQTDDDWSDSRDDWGGNNLVGRFYGNNEGNEYALTNQFKINDFRDKFSFPNRYRNLDKLRTFPYTCIEITTYSGNTIVIQPELIRGDDLYINTVINPVPPNERLIIYPEGYNSAYETSGYDPEMKAKYSEFFNVTTGILDLPSVPVVNNSAMMSLANQAHSLSQSRKAADWSQQKALQGASMSYQQATKGMEGSMQDVAIQQGLAVSQQQLQAETAQKKWGVDTVSAGAKNIGGGIIGGAMSGGPVGMLVGGGAGLVNTAIDGVASYAGMSISNQAAAQQVALSNAASSAGLRNSMNVGEFMRDTNNEYAAMAATGDYAQTIAAINAKVQDLEMLPATVQGAYGGDSLNLNYQGWRVFVKYKQIFGAHIHALGSFWLRYGYAIQRFSKMPANYQVMEKFTYWKLAETTITSGSVPENFRQAIRGIFEKGVTVWNQPSYIGNTNLDDNEPLNGIVL